MDALVGTVEERCAQSLVELQEKLASGSSGKTWMSVLSPRIKDVRVCQGDVSRAQDLMDNKLKDGMRKRTLAAAALEFHIPECVKEYVRQKTKTERAFSSSMEAIMFMVNHEGCTTEWALKLLNVLLTMEETSLEDKLIVFTLGQLINDRDTTRSTLALLNEVVSRKGTKVNLRLVWNVLDVAASIAEEDILNGVNYWMDIIRVARSHLSFTSMVTAEDKEYMLSIMRRTVMNASPSEPRSAEILEGARAALIAIGKLEAFSVDSDMLSDDMFEGMMDFF